MDGASLVGEIDGTGIKNSANVGVAPSQFPDVASQVMY